MPPLTLRADVVPESLNIAERTVDVVFSTGAAVRRMDWNTERPFLEVLSMKPSAVRLGRLNNGAPLIDSHGGFGGPRLRDILGVVEPGSASVSGGKGKATTRFSKRADVEPIWQDVRDKIIRNVSVGYRVHTYERTPPAENDQNALETRTAVDWEPFEISAVPIGADAGAQVRADEQPETNPCVIVTRGHKETHAMEDETRSESIVEVDPLVQPAERAAATVTEPTERDAGAAAENERVDGIRQACVAARMSRTFEDGLIKDWKMSLVKAQGLIFDELRKRGYNDDGPRATPSGATNVEFGADPLIHVREGIKGALLNRIAADRFPLDEKSRPYRGMSMLDIGRAFLHARGVRTTSMDRSRLVDVLLTRTGLHTTTDFPGLFEDAANKNLRAAYEAAPQTWLPISKLVSLSDFKPSRQLQVGDAPALLEILEHGEYTFGTIGEAKESIQLKTYGRIFGITRQALINDDLNAFGEVPAAFGRKARDVESDLAWAQITSNPTMGDGAALFVAATHFNYTSPGSTVAIASLGVGRGALRAQKGIDGVTLLNLPSSYLIVPAALETVAEQFVSQYMPNVAANVNAFGPGGRTPVSLPARPRPDVASTTAWYMATNLNSAPVLYHGILDGQEGPLVTQQEGFEVDGMKFRCRIDVAFKAADWRAVYKNVGA